jgi:hypothetical protein
MLMQVAAFSFTKIDNSFAFFDLRHPGIPPARMAKPKEKPVATRATRQIANPPSGQLPIRAQAAATETPSLRSRPGNDHPAASPLKFPVISRPGVFLDCFARRRDLTWLRAWQRICLVSLSKHGDNDGIESGRRSSIAADN